MCFLIEVYLMPLKTKGKLQATKVAKFLQFINILNYVGCLPYLQLQSVPQHYECEVSQKFINNISGNLQNISFKYILNHLSILTEILSRFSLISYPVYDRIIIQSLIYEIQTLTNLKVGFVPLFFKDPRICFIQYTINEISQRYSINYNSIIHCFG